jgi:hypothetical protein
MSSTSPIPSRNGTHQADGGQPGPTLQPNRRQPRLDGWFGVSRAVFDARVSSVTKIVYVALASHANDHGRCWPPLDLLIEETGLSRRSVIRSVQQLEELHLLTVDRSNGKGSVYTLPPLRSQGDTVNQCPTGTSAPQAPHQCPTGTTPVPHRHHTSAPQAPHQCPTGTQTIPSNENQERHSRARPKRGVEGLLGKKKKGFEEFWAAYPKRVNQDEAEKAWSKLNPDEALLATILAALMRQRNSKEWKKNDGEYIPHPNNWLNDRRWRDEVKHGPKSSAQFDQSQADEYYPDANQP